MYGPLNVRLLRNFITDEINIQFLLLSVYVAWSSKLLKSSEGTYIQQGSKYVYPRINPHNLSRNIISVGEMLHTSKAAALVVLWGR